MAFSFNMRLFHLCGTFVAEGSPLNAFSQLGLGDNLLQLLHQYFPLHLALVIETASSLKLHELISASFQLFFSFHTSQPRQNWREVQPYSALGLGLRACCSWLDLLSRLLKLSQYQQQVYSTFSSSLRLLEQHF